MLRGDANWVNPPASDSACRTDVSLRRGYVPGFATFPMTKYFGALTCRTITDTWGSLMKLRRPFRIVSASSLAVFPSATTSWMSGIEIFPSGRTTRSSVNSLFSHTEILMTSSGPILYWGPERTGSGTDAVSAPFFTAGAGREVDVGWTSASVIDSSLMGAEE